MNKPYANAIYIVISDRTCVTRLGDEQNKLFANLFHPIEAICSGRLEMPIPIGQLRTPPFRPVKMRGYHVGPLCDAGVSVPSGLPLITDTNAAITILPFGGISNLIGQRPPNQPSSALYFI